MITFEPFLNLPLKLELCFDYLIIHVADEFGTSALELDHQDQIGLQTLTVFEKKLNHFTFFHYTLRLEL